MREMILGAQHRLRIIEKRQEPKEALLDLVEMVGQRRVEACDGSILTNIGQGGQCPGRFRHLGMEALLDVWDLRSTGTIATRAERCQYPRALSPISHIERR